MRRTKIIATFGPAVDTPEKLGQLIEAGADVIRLNFSHGSWDEYQRQIAMIREVALRLGRHVAILGDLQGPKIRIDKFRNAPIQLVPGQRFALDSSLDPAAGDETEVGVAYDQLADDVSAGDTLLLDDGNIVLKAEAVTGTRIDCTVTIGGPLGNNKGINLQGGGLSAPALTEKDKADLERVAEFGLDWLAVSFVQSSRDVKRARKILRKHGSHAHVIAKIERSEAIDNLMPIIDASDAVMVARGDLGVEMGYAGLAGLQKNIIRMTRARHKVCITATQMMESMISSQMPTRAEVSDVANAVMDGTDAVMLSAETAVGEYPVQAVASMAEVCVGAESYHQTASRVSRHRMDDRFEHVDEAIAMAVMYTANHMEVKAIIAMTESGATVKWMSRIRSDIPIFAFTPNEATLCRVALYRGVMPVAYSSQHEHTEPVFRDVCRILTHLGYVESGDLVIFTKGMTKGETGGTNEMRILSVTSQ
ncbi:MAG: pyruvate kinase [Gammaproteobacteria bacterium]